MQSVLQISLGFRLALAGLAVVAAALWLVLPSGATSPAELFVDADDPNCTDAPAAGAGAPATPYCSIQSAIDFLENKGPGGGTLTLRAAVYDEGTITVDHRDLLIRGDSNVLRSAIVVHPDGSGDVGFHISDPLDDCDNITIEHLTLDGTSPLTTGAGISVDDTCDGHTFRDVEIRNWGGQGIVFADSSADGAQNASDGNQVMSSVVRDNGEAGIELRDGTGNVLGGVETSGNGGHGVSAHREDGLSIETAAVLGNAGHGVWLFEGVDTTLSGSSVVGNAGVAVFATGPHTGHRFTDNDINENGLGGLHFKTGLLSEGGIDTAITGNAIGGNGGNGIDSTSHEQVLIRDNDIIGNSGAGIALADNVNTTVDQNDLSENVESGLEAQNETGFVVSENTADANGLHGIALDGGPSPVVRDNSASGNANLGISARRLFGPTLARNTAVANGGAGIDVRDNTDALVEASEFAMNGAEGLIATDETGLSVVGNSIHDNDRTGLRIVRGGDISIVANHDIADNGTGGTPLDYGVHASQTSGLAIDKNIVRRNLDGQLVIDASSEVSITKNDIVTAVDAITLMSSSSHAFGVTIGGASGEYNRFRGLTPATNECNSPDDVCYVKFPNTVVPGAPVNAQYNDWGTTNPAQIENVVCHDGEGNNQGQCGLNVINFANSATPSDTSPADKDTGTSCLTAGDVDGDGDVDSIDAVLTLQFIADLLPALPCPQSADVNNDGTANSIDVALILQFTAGLIGEL